MDNQNLANNEPEVQSTNIEGHLGHSPDNTDSPPLNPWQKHFRKRTVIAGIILIVSCLLAGGIYWFLNYRSNQRAATSQTSSTHKPEETLTVAGMKLTKSDCATVKAKIKKQTNGDLCYETTTTVQSEKVQYLVVKESQASYKEAQSKCTMDCGSWAGGLSRNDYVIRTNGTVEDVPSDLSSSVDLYLNPLTGCSQSLDNIKNSKNELPVAKLIKNDQRIGFQFSIKNSKYTDNFGNKCIISATWKSFATAPEINFTSIKVHYDIKPADSCDSQKELSVTSCYATQAALRSDITLCNKADEGVALGNNQDCITGVATRQRDEDLCKQIADDYFRKSCETNVASSIEDFSGKLEAY